MRKYFIPGFLRYWKKYKNNMCKKYSKEEIENRIDIAVDMLKCKDLFLLQKDVNERGITHKLAEYLQQQFPEYNVDCEYNRMKNQKMDDKYITKKLNLPIVDLRSNDTTAKTVYPDIIIHKRGTENNLVVIEIKKKLSDEDKKYDINKLEAFKKQLGYKNSLFIEFDNKGNFEKKWI